MIFTDKRPSDNKPFAYTTFVCLGPRHSPYSHCLCLMSDIATEEPNHFIEKEKYRFILSQIFFALT